MNISSIASTGALSPIARQSPKSEIDSRNNVSRQPPSESVSVKISDQGRVRANLDSIRESTVSTQSAQSQSIQSNPPNTQSSRGINAYQQMSQAV